MSIKVIYLFLKNKLFTAKQLSLSMFRFDRASLSGQRDQGLSKSLTRERLSLKLEVVNPTGKLDSDSHFRCTLTNLTDTAFLIFSGGSIIQGLPMFCDPRGYGAFPYNEEYIKTIKKFRIRLEKFQYDKLGKLEAVRGETLVSNWVEVDTEAVSAILRKERERWKR